jgi:hypothetical protein
MMMRPKIIWASVALGVLTLGGLDSLYWLAFDVWMTAYPLVNPNEWRPRFYIQLIVTVVVGLLWGLLAVWLFRQRRQGRETR